MELKCLWIPAVRLHVGLFTNTFIWCLVYIILSDISHHFTGRTCHMRMRNTALAAIPIYREWEVRKC